MGDAGAHRGPIGVVLPGYGHPQFLAEAVVSACEQDINADIKVVVVDDGCRFQETGEVVQNLVRQYPGKLHYLRQENKRLPGARNAGIRFLLQMEPNLDSIYFLDADNRIAPYSLRRFREALGDDPSIGWAYPDIAFFGLTWSEIGVDVRETAPDYSRLKHLAGNISEAGSLVRAEVFRKGVFFDESMRSGFEDWDFWLSALEAGYVGVRAEQSGFMYRRRPESMLAESRRLEEELIARLRRQHAPLFRPRQVMQLEHEEAPYFALFFMDMDQVILTSDPLLPGECLTKAEFFSRFRRWCHNPREFFFPAQLICMTEPTWNALQDTPHWLRWLFWVIKGQGNQCEFYSLRAGSQPSVAGASQTDVEPFASIMSVDAATLQAIAMDGDPNGWSENLPISYFSASLPGLEDANCVALSASQACQELGHFAQQAAATVQTVSYIDRRYAGPDGRTIRLEFIDPLCAEEDHKPYPCAADTKRILLATDHSVLQSREGLERFVSLLNNLVQKDVEVLLSLEFDVTFDVETLQPEKWLDLVTDIVPVRYCEIGQGYRMYLGRRITTPPSDFNRLAASIVSRSVDAILTLGAPAFLKVLGMARVHGVKGYVLLDKAFMPTDTGNSSALLSTVLAFEHAEEYLVTDEAALKTILSAEGVPPSKLIGYTEFLDQAPWEN